MRVLVGGSVLFISVWLLLLHGFVGCQRPAAVTIAAIYTYDSVIGRAAGPAMDAAIFDVNKDDSILTGTKLMLLHKDVNCSVFMGSVAAFQVIENEIVSIIGPQSSGIAHMISAIANGLQVPLVSYAATDPTLSASQFPFFVRTTQSDSYQMAAIAQFVTLYGWREVITIFLDDDYGRNGIASLEDELGKKMVKISHKVPLPSHCDEFHLMNELNKTKLLGPRIYVVHVSPNPGFQIFNIAYKLQMMTDTYVWLATDWLSTTLDSISPMKPTSLGVLQGVVGFRQHTLESSQKSAFVSGWKERQQNGLASSGLNTYALQAYDTVWAVAYAINKFLNEFQNFSFSPSSKLLDVSNSQLQLGELKVFNGGSYLLDKILQTNFTGLSGKVQFNQEHRNIVSGGYDIINIDQMSIHTIGYWSNDSGFSLLPPEGLKGERKGQSQFDQKLKKIVWPGGKTGKPRGWVIAVDDRPLRIGVPNRSSFTDFVTEEHGSIKGYCIDVFLEARKLVPYHVPYKFVAFGDGRFNPKYDELVNKVADNVLDGAVGDIAIVKNRTMIVDFTQPYADTGLVIVTPARTSKSSAWVFLQPFTLEMWGVTASSFLIIAVVIWILEHRVNDDFRGPPRRQIVTMLVFSFSTLFKTNQENTISPLSRLVMVVWLFLLLVITASYTASFTSILTVQQLSSPFTDIDSLVASNFPIGYQVGSFVYDYLSESMYVPRSRLISLASPDEYARALRQGPYDGGVAAIVDELPYIEEFLSEQNANEFAIVGQPFTRNGWGFAFRRESPLSFDMSTAILKLSESGKLQEIHEQWFCKQGCAADRKRNTEPNQLNLISFWGLYLLCGAFTLTALILFLLRMVRQYTRYKRAQRHLSSPFQGSRSTHCSQVIYNFLDFIDEREEAIKKLFKQAADHPQPQPQPQPAPNS